MRALIENILAVDKFNFRFRTNIYQTDAGQFAKKHAKIGIVEQQIEMIEDEASDKPAATTRTPSARSSKSRATSSAKSKRSSNQSPKQIEAKLKMEEPLNVSTSKSKKVFNLSNIFILYVLRKLSLRL